MLIKKRLAKKEHITSPSGSDTSLSKTRVGSVRRTILGAKKTKLIIAVIILFSVVLAIFLLYKKNNSTQQINYDDYEVFTMSGEEVKVPKAFLNITDSTKEAKPEPLDERIEKLKKQMEEGEKSYESYYRLAQLYDYNNDKENAIKHYEYAKSAIDPSDPRLDEKVKTADTLIAELKSRSE